MEERTLTREQKSEASNAQWRLRTNETLGCFRIIRPLGRGGMGEVYEVEHIHLLKRYALKLLMGGDAVFVARFRREARIMADMRHPNLVAVHDLEVDEKQGRCFLVMDFVVGPKSAVAQGETRVLPTGDAWLGDSCSLADRVPRPGHRLDEHCVRKLALEVCEALRYAHTFGEGGVVHRDLKPSNILLDADGHAVVADFGVAKIVGEAGRKGVMEAAQDDAESCASQVLGTAEYMAPEQRAGQAVSPQTDLYAMGVVLYRLLTGYLPTGLWKVPSKCGAGCSRGWDQIVCRCLAFDPAARYADASELSRALASLRLSADGGRARRSVAGWAAAAVLAMAIAVVGGFVLSSGWQRNEATSGQPVGDCVGTSVDWHVSLADPAADIKSHAAWAVDGDPLTVWKPRAGDRDAALSLDLGSVREIGGVTCRMPVAVRMGTVEESPVAVEVAVSRDGLFWSVVAGAFSPALEGADGQFRFDHPLSGQYVRVHVLAASQGTTAVVPELGFLLADGRKVRLSL